MFIGREEGPGSSFSCTSQESTFFLAQIGCRAARSSVLQVETLLPHRRQLCRCHALRHFDLLFAAVFKIIFPSHILPWMLLKSASPHTCHTEQGTPSTSLLCKKWFRRYRRQNLAVVLVFITTLEGSFRYYLILGEGANRMQENITSATWSFNLNAQNLHVDIQSSDKNLILF